MKLFLLTIFGSLLILANSISLFEKQPFDGFTRYGCGRDGHCSMIISVLRDPRLMPAWTTKANAWDKAIEQMQAYQQLFSSENDEPEGTLENVESLDIPTSSSRSKRFLPIFTPKRHRPSKDNMYWLIRMPGK